MALTLVGVLDDDVDNVDVEDNDTLEEASATSLKKLTATLVASNVDDDIEDLARPKCSAN